MNFLYVYISYSLNQIFLASKTDIKSMDVFHIFYNNLKAITFTVKVSV